MGTQAQTNGRAPNPQENLSHSIQPISSDSHPTFAQDNLFIGRARELATIDQCFQDPGCRLLTLIGLGGVGKTRIAWEAGSRLAHHSSDGSYFIPFAPISSPTLIVSTLAASLGYQFQGPEPPLIQLIDFLRNRDLLLVLDNFEHLLSGADLIAEILHAAPNLRLLITSRERLNLQQEWVLDIHGLDYPYGATEDNLERYSAMQFFLQCARRAKADFQFTDANQSDVIRICRLVEGVPLGIELATSWVRALSCRAIGDEIERNLDFLTTRLRDVPDKHRSMRAVFAHTYALLTAEQQQSFSKLSVFRGGFRREGAEAVAGATLDMLAALLDKSLLRVDADGRYDMHELLRQYGDQQLHASGAMEVVRAAHSTYYAEFLQQKWQPLRSARQALTLNEIETEFANVRAAWQNMVEQRDAAGLSLSVYSLWFFNDLRSRLENSVGLFKEAEEALRPVSGEAERDRAIGQLIISRAWFMYSALTVEEARALAEEGLAILQRVGSPEDVAMAFYARCAVDAWANDLPALKRNGEQMAQIARHIGDDWLLASALFSLSSVSARDDDLEEAARHGQAFFECAEASGDPDLRIMSLLSVQQVGSF